MSSTEMKNRLRMLAEERVSMDGAGKSGVYHTKKFYDTHPNYHLNKPVPSHMTPEYRDAHPDYRPQSQDHYDRQMEIARGGGLKKWAKRAAGDVNKFAKESNIISNVALATGRPELALATGMMGYGRPLSRWQMYVKEYYSDLRRSLINIGYTPKEASAKAFSDLGKTYREENPSVGYTTSGAKKAPRKKPVPLRTLL